MPAQFLSDASDAIAKPPWLVRVHHRDPQHRRTGEGYGREGVPDRAPVDEAQEKRERGRRGDRTDVADQYAAAADGRNARGGPVRAYVPHQADEDDGTSGDNHATGSYQRRYALRSGEPERSEAGDDSARNGERRGPSMSASTPEGSCRVA